MGKQNKNEYIKQKTLELYDSLPQDKEARKSRVDIRDQILELNYTFFGYVASHTYIHNTSVTYEDKFQSAISGFLYCWWWYKWLGDETHKGYRTDLSFSVFFKPRIGEMIERELNDVKYSIRRSLCMEVGAQLGKHWSQVRYEDLSKVNLPPDKMNSLKAIFGTIYWSDLESESLYLEAPKSTYSKFDNLTDKYDTIEELLIREMVDRESKLTDSMLLDIADLYGLDYQVLRSKRSIAEQMLYSQLHNDLDAIDI